MSLCAGFVTDASGNSSTAVQERVALAGHGAYGVRPSFFMQDAASRPWTCWDRGGGAAWPLELGT